MTEDQLLPISALQHWLFCPRQCALISRTTSPSRQGAMLGLNMSVGAFSRAIGPAAGGALFSIAGADVPLFAAAIVVAPAILLAWQAEGAAKRLRMKEAA